MRAFAVLSLCALFGALPQLASAQGWHRMGGTPNMPAEMLKPPEGAPHHIRYHKDGTEPNNTFSFGQPGDPMQAARTIDMEIRDESGYSESNLQVRAGETVRFVVHNSGSTKHELRIGDPDYQKAHDQMLARAPGMEHDDPNATVIGPGETAWIVWRFGNSPIVQLACRLTGQYRRGQVAIVRVTE